MNDYREVMPGHVYMHELDGETIAIISVDYDMGTCEALCLDDDGCGSRDIYLLRTVADMTRVRF